MHSYLDNPILGSARPRGVALLLLLTLSAPGCGSEDASAQPPAVVKDAAVVDGRDASEEAKPPSDSSTSADAAKDLSTSDEPTADANLDDGPTEEAAPVVPTKPIAVATSTCSAAQHQNENNSAYPTDFQQAVADDWVYIAWMWRVSSDAATNHSISAMKSKDMKTWYNLCGDPVSLPVTTKSQTVFDPVPIKAGLLNSSFNLSFDANKRAVITYQKNAPKGSGQATQVFGARWEDKAIKIYQLTDWDSLDDFGGGGSLPSRPTAIGFSGLKIGPTGVVGQSFRRSKQDDEACATLQDAGKECSAFPQTGVWAIDDSKDGLAIHQPLQATTSAQLASNDPFENPTTAALNAGPSENPPFSDPNAAAWQVRTLMSRAETRWITLRASFGGGSAHSPGLFDRYNSMFRIEANGSTSTFQFGARAGLFWPLAGDWNSDGVDTIGVHSTVTNTTFLKNSLSGGNADSTSKGPYSEIQNVADSPLAWNDANPAARFAIRWEALPTNRDLPYSCKGIALTSETGACTDESIMSSNLYVFEYDTAQGAWKKSLIDRAWAGSSARFDFLTFKNVQLVLYYGKDRHLKVAQRVRKSGLWSSWAFSTLASVFGGWDSHNYLTMMIDQNHNVHVSGNMHGVPLVYYRGTGSLGATDPLTYTSMSMTGQNEEKTTYPLFLRSPKGDLLFEYRSGGSGQGDTYINVYDEDTQKWSPYHTKGSPPVAKPIFQGQ